MHPLARPQHLLGGLAVATSMSRRVAIPTFSELARYTSAQLAVEVVEEVPLPLFVLF